MHCNFTIAMLENDILLTVECHVTLMNSRGPTFTDLANEILKIKHLMIMIETSIEYHIDHINKVQCPLSMSLVVPCMGLVSQGSFH